jgi:hypothetical protein
MLRGLPFGRLTVGGLNTSADHRLAPRLLVLPGVAPLVARPPRELCAPRVLLLAPILYDACVHGYKCRWKRCTDEMAYDAHACMCM